MRESQLKRAFHALRCDVFFDSKYKALYAADSSNYRQVPIGVVKPKTPEDIIQTVEICRNHDLPVLSRGGGTSLAGQCCNTAIVMDMSQYYNRILEFNPEARTALVEPGLVLDVLRERAETHHLTFPPDPSTHNRCTIGGMIGNNSCGVHALMAGKTEENILELDILTYDGERMTVGATSEAELQRIIAGGGRRGEIYGGLKNLAERHEAEIRERYPQIPRRVSGYNLNELLPENGFHVARSLVGTESTCVTVLRAKVRLVHSPAERALAVIGFTDIFAAGDSIPSVLRHHPIGLEGVDNILVTNMRTKRLHISNLRLLPDGSAWLFVELGTDDPAELKERIRLLEMDARRLAGFKGVCTLFDRGEQRRLWEVREAGLGATAYVPGKPDTWEGWEDSAVPPEKVGAYLRDLKKLYRKFDYDGALYGHFGQGCIHTRINFDLVTKAGIEKFHRFIGEAAELVTSYGGSLSGEHGDGQSKAEFLPVMFGPRIVRAFEEFKSIWDPAWKMNPGKIVRPFKNTENLRLGTNYAPWEPRTKMRFPEDHGAFSRAALRCVGVGLCRREHGGVMCPSYRATHEEEHSTRGRAHLLFEMLRGEVIKDGWRSEEVKDALDLCLACKGCKNDCPVNVDMAAYKAEFLSHYYRGRVRPRVAYSMGQIMRLAPLASLAPGLSNFLTHAPGFSFLAKQFAGIHPDRDVPRFARHPFRKRVPLSKFSKADGRPEVILWVDTFNNFFHPQIAAAAWRVLEKAGYRVRITEKRLCCGRPLYDFGFLDQARRRLRRVLDVMRADIRAGTPIVFLEPSCASVLRDELCGFFPHDQDAMRLKTQSLMLSEFLLERAPDFPWPKVSTPVMVQGHCHQHSVLNFDAHTEAVKKLGAAVEVFDEGCCGMAGAFGFEKKHFAVSQAIGEHALFPKIRKAGDGVLLIANGFSCREQIRQGCGRHAYHLAQVLDESYRGEKWK